MAIQPYDGEIIPIQSDSDSGSSPTSVPTIETQRPYVGASLAGVEDDVADRFEAMARDYQTLVGEPVKLNSSFRTYERQAEIYRTARPGYAARPGNSLHEVGKALDIDETQAHELDALGLLSEYGFHRPLMGQTKSGVYEPWHIQPVEGFQRQADRAAKIAHTFPSGKPVPYEGEILPLPGKPTPVPYEGEILPLSGSVAPVLSPASPNIFQQPGSAEEASVAGVPQTTVAPIPVPQVVAPAPAPTPVFAPDIAENLRVQGETLTQSARDISASDKQLRDLKAYLESGQPTPDDIASFSDAVESHKNMVARHNAGIQSIKRQAQGYKQLFSDYQTDPETFFTKNPQYAPPGWTLEGAQKDRASQLEAEKSGYMVSPATGEVVRPLLTQEESTKRVMAQYLAGDNRLPEDRTGILGAIDKGIKWAAQHLATGPLGVVAVAGARGLKQEQPQPPLASTLEMTGQGALRDAFFRAYQPPKLSIEEQNKGFEGIRSAGGFLGMALPIGILNKAGVKIADYMVPEAMGTVFNKVLGLGFGLGVFGGGSAVGETYFTGQKFDDAAKSMIIDSTIDSALLGSFFALGLHGAAKAIERLFAIRGLPTARPDLNPTNIMDAFDTLNSLRANGSLTEGIIRGNPHLLTAVELEGRFKGKSTDEIKAALKKWYYEKYGSGTGFTGTGPTATEPTGPTAGPPTGPPGPRPQITPPAPRQLTTPDQGFTMGAPGIQPNFTMQPSGANVPAVRGASGQIVPQYEVAQTGQAPLTTPAVATTAEPLPIPSPKKIVAPAPVETGLGAVQGKEPWEMDSKEWVEAVNNGIVKGDKGISFDLKEVLSGNKPATDISIGHIESQAAGGVGPKILQDYESGRLAERVNKSGKVLKEIDLPEQGGKTVIIAQTQELADRLAKALQNKHDVVELGRLYGYSPEDVAYFYDKAGYSHPTFLTNAALNGHIIPPEVMAEYPGLTEHIQTIAKKRGMKSVPTLSQFPPAAEAKGKEGVGEQELINKGLLRLKSKGFGKGKWYQYKDADNSWTTTHDKEKAIAEASKRLTPESAPKTLVSTAKLKIRFVKEYGVVGGNRFARFEVGGKTYDIKMREGKDETLRSRLEARAEAVRQYKEGEGQATTKAPEQTPIRFEIGKKLTKEERQKVLENMGDVYRDAKLPKDELKAEVHGDPVYGYPHTPELFIKSDITGKMIRHYIQLPDGRIAHPSELFPEITESVIQRHIREAKFKAQQAKLEAEFDRKAKLQRIASPDDPRGLNNAANENYNRTNRKIEGSYWAKNDKGQMVRVDGKDPKDVAFYEGEGFTKVDPLAAVKAFQNKFGTSRNVGKPEGLVIKPKKEYKEAILHNVSAGSRFIVQTDPRPDNVPRGWLVFNAPRPLAGDVEWKGEFRHGVFFAAVNPLGERAQWVVENNKGLDAWPVIYKTKDAIQKAAIAKLKEDYPNVTIDKNIEGMAIDNYLSSLSDMKYGESPFFEQNKFETFHRILDDTHNERFNENMRLVGNATSVEMQSTRDPNVKIIIHKSTYPGMEGQWQISRFDQHGPSGHHNAKSLEAAIREEGLSGEFVVSKTGSTKKFIPEPSPKTRGTAGRVGVPKDIVSKSARIAQASDRGDLRTIIKLLGGIRSDSNILKNFPLEERRKLVGLITKDGIGADVLADTLNKEYPDLAGFERDEDLIRYLVDGTYKKLLNKNILAEEEAYYEDQAAREAARTGVSEDDLSEADRIAEREVAREEIAGRSVESVEPGEDFFSFAEPRTKPKTSLATRLDKLQEDYPDIDREKAATVIRALPNAEDGQIANMSADPEMFNQVAKGNLSASAKTQLLKNSSDASQQGSLLGEGPQGGLFAPKYSLKQALSPYNSPNAVLSMRSIFVKSDKDFTILRNPSRPDLRRILRENEREQINWQGKPYPVSHSEVRFIDVGGNRYVFSGELIHSEVLYQLREHGLVEPGDRVNEGRANIKLVDGEPKLEVGYVGKGVVGDTPQQVKYGAYLPVEQTSGGSWGKGVEPKYSLKQARYVPEQGIVATLPNSVTPWKNDLSIIKDPTKRDFDRIKNEGGLGARFINIGDSQYVFSNNLIHAEALKALHDLGIVKPNDEIGYGTGFIGEPPGKILRITQTNTGYVNRETFADKYLTMRPVYTLKQARALAPTFFSQMVDFLSHPEHGLPKKGDPDKLIKFIEDVSGQTQVGVSKKGHPVMSDAQIKPDEVRLSGIIPWLSKQTGPVMRHQVIEKLKEGWVAVKVRTMGGETGVDFEELHGLYVKEVGLASVDSFRQSFNDPSLKAEMRQNIVDHAKTSEGKKRLLDILDGKGEGGLTKFQSHLTDLPASFTNRREILLTVPRTRTDTGQIRKQFEDRMKDKYGKFDHTLFTDEEIVENKSTMANVLKSGGKEFEVSKEYKVPSSHAYGDPAADVNRFAHVFTADFIDPVTGKKDLVVTEVQSDWAAKIRREGVQGEKEVKIEFRPKEDEKYPWTLTIDGEVIERHKLEEVAKQEAIDLQKRWKSGAPPLPFAKNYHEVALKQAIRFASENGYDGVMVVNGDMVKQRYDLSKLVDKLIYVPETETLTVHKKDGEMEYYPDYPPDKLDKIIGKEYAKKLMETVPTTDYGDNRLPAHILEGEGMKVGGQWANNLYDKTMPSFLKSYVKQWGVEVGRKDVARGEMFEDEIMPLNSPREVRMNWQDGQIYDKDGVLLFDPKEAREGETYSLRPYATTKYPLTHFPIPQSMTDSVLYRGQPLYKPKEIPSEKPQTAEVGTQVGAGTAQAKVSDSGSSILPVKGRDTLLPQDAAGQGRQLESVKSGVAKIVPREEYAGFWRDAAFDGGFHGTPEHLELQAYAAQFGINHVIPVKGAGFDGAITSTPDGSVILIDSNISTGATKKQVAGHEIFHDLIKRFDPGALQLLAMVDTKSPSFVKFQEAYLEPYRQQGLELPEVPAIAQELAGDFFGGMETKLDINGNPYSLNKAFSDPVRAFVTVKNIHMKAGKEVGGAGVRGPPGPQYMAKKTPEPEGKTTGTKNAVTEAEIEARGLLPVQRKILKVEPRFNDAKKMVDKGELDPRAIALEIANKPRVMSDIEDAALKYDRMRLFNAHSSAMNTIEKATAKGDMATLLEQRQQLARIEDAINTNDIALKHAGTMWSASGRMRQYLIAQDYSLARTLQRIRVQMVGKEIPAELRQKIEDLTKQLQEVQAKLDEREAKLAEIEAAKTVKQINRKIDESIKAHREKRVPREKLKAEFQSLADKFRATIGQIHMNIDPGQVLILAEMARNRVMDGILDAKEIVADIYQELKDIPDLTERDIRDALSEYGKTSKPSQDEILAALREARRQMRLISAIEDAESGQVPLRSGFQRDPVTDKVREYQKEVRQAMRESGIDSASVRTPEEQWRTSLDAVKTRLKNQIHDITEQLKTGKKTPKKPGIRYDQEANDLKAERDILRKALQEIEGKPTLSPEQRIRMATNAVEKSIAEYERRIKERDLNPAKKVSATPDTPELKGLRSRRDALVETYRQMQKDAKPTPDPTVAALKAYKTRTLKRIDTLQEMLTTGNFEKSARRVLKLDPEAQRLKNQAEQLKDKIDNEVRRQKLANRTTLEKTLDWMVKFRRAVILSGVGTIVKLTTAATMRQITTPAEELAGSVLRQLPYISRIDAMAPREGGGLNVRAEAAAFRQWFEKQTWRDVVDVAKTGYGSLDRMYGKKHDLPPEAMDFFGHLHGALKVTPKRSEFYRSLQKQAEWYMKNGYDMTDPTTIATIELAAYIDANRAIFLNDNLMTDAFRRLLGMLRNEKTGNGGKITASVLQILLPIVKVPTNFVKEAFNYAGGGTYATYKLLEKKGPDLKRGIASLTPEEADSVMRSLKKQFWGLILLLIGYFGSDDIGGYFIRGEKRKGSDVEPGGLKIFGVKAPHLMLHTPALEILQMGATLKRVQDYYAKRNAEILEKNVAGGLEGMEKAMKGDRFDATVAGAYIAGIGALKQVPFMETPGRMYEASRTPGGIGKVAKQLIESLVTPPDLRRIAKAMDKAGEEQIPREQGTLLQTLQGSVPGQRSKLPLDIDRLKKLPLDRMMEVIEKSPSGTINQKEAGILADSLDNRTKSDKAWDSLTPAERARVDFLIKKLDRQAGMRK